VTLSSRRASNMAKRPRLDTKRQKLYDAEAGAFRGDDVRFQGVAQAQAYVNRLCDLAWFRRRWGSRRITVFAKRGSGGYARGSADVHIGFNATGVYGKATAGSCSRLIVLHEMAHTLSGDVEAEGWHGPTFCRVLFELTRYAVSAEVAEKLRQEYKAHKLRMGSPTKLRAADRVPAPRPVAKVWRVQIGKAEPLVVEGINLRAIVRELTLNGKLSDATELRIWKSRATFRKAAGKGSK
jgi:putative metallohydrolase (TIGR04338 family)